MLLTNIECDTFQEVIEKIAWYKVRWQVEVFHKVLKSGCRVEDCRLKSVKALTRYLTLMSIVAWRLQWLTYIDRKDSGISCTVAFNQIEWKALYLKFNGGQKIPEKPPTLRQCIIWLARLGGFLNRSSDKYPGITHIWRGWQRFCDIVDDYELFTRNICG